MKDTSRTFAVSVPLSDTKTREALKKLDKLPINRSKLICKYLVKVAQEGGDE